MAPETPKILTDEDKKALAENIVLNGGEIIDPDFAELEEFLKLNPPETAKS